MVDDVFLVYQSQLAIDLPHTRTDSFGFSDAIEIENLRIIIEALIPSFFFIKLINTFKERSYLLAIKLVISGIGSDH